VQRHVDLDDATIFAIALAPDTHVVDAFTTLRNDQVQQQPGWRIGARTRCEHGRLQVPPAEALEPVRFAAVS
jgi:hypothetical protein